MRRNAKFIWCLLAALLFCAVTYGGCGGSGNMADPAKSTSGDTTGGRGDWEEWEIVDALSILENTWRITNVDLDIDPNNDWFLLSDIENSTVKITIGERTKKNVGKLNLSRNLLCEFT